MENKKTNKTGNNVNTKANVEKEANEIIKKSTLDFDFFNLDEKTIETLAQKISSNKKTKSLYVYPDKIESDKKKIFRRRIRAMQIKFCNQIVNDEKDKENLKLFLIFYKSFFSNPNFTIHSFTSKSEKEAEKDIEVFKKALNLSQSFLKENKLQISDIPIKQDTFNSLYKDLQTS